MEVKFFKEIRLKGGKFEQRLVEQQGCQVARSTGGNMRRQGQAHDCLPVAHAVMVEGTVRAIQIFSI